eukprot:3203668-Rhodomonas_salina.4
MALPVATIVLISPLTPAGARQANLKDLEHKSEPSGGSAVSPPWHSGVREKPWLSESRLGAESEWQRCHGEPGAGRGGGLDSH